MGSGDLNYNSCRPAEIIPKVINPLATTINSDDLQLLPSLRLDLSLVKLKRRD
jgi:hypothetical protein